MKNPKEFFVAEDIIDAGDSFVAAFSYGGVLCQFDKKDLSILRSTKISGEKSGQFLLYMKSVIAGDNIYFAPFYAEQICVYNFKRNEISYIDISENCSNKTVGEKYNHIFNSHSNLYFLGYKQPYILKLNTENKDLKYIGGWDEQLQQYNIDCNWGYFSQGSIVHDEKVLLPFGCTGRILELDLKTDSTRVLDVSFCNELNGIGGITEDSKGLIWVSSRNEENHKLISWDRKTNTHVAYLFPEKISRLGSYYAPIILDDGILVIPETMDHTYFLAYEDNKLRICDGFDNIIHPFDKSNFFGASVVSLRQIGDQLMFFTTTDYAWNVYNIRTHVNTKCWLSTTEDCKSEYTKMLENKINNDGIVIEGDVSLLDYIGVIK